MTNYIVFNGKDSRNIEGLVICELPPISKPKMRVTETVIAGVDGSTLEELGFESYDKALTIGLTQKADIDEVVQFFSGNGEVVFSNEADKYYKASVVGKIDFKRLVRFKVATVTFRVQPFKYALAEKEVTYDVTKAEDVSVNNDGNYFAKPVIEIKGAGTITFSVNGNTSFRYTFPDGEDTVVIDSQKQDAYYGAILKNRNMSGEFPAFATGENVISWDGTISSLKITSKSRWL